MEPEREQQMGCVKQCLQWFSAGTAIISAGLWFYSAVIKVKPDSARLELNGMQPFTHTDTDADSDVHGTLRKQSKWNACAAAVASVAAFTQGISMLIPD